MNQVERRAFDLLIFLPDQMPPILPPSSGTADGGIVGGTPRVIPAYRDLPLNPNAVLAMMLPIAGSVYSPPPDETLLAIETECLEIRGKWNAQIPKSEA